MKRKEMKKTYIAPASQLKMVAAQQMMALSLLDEPADDSDVLTKEDKTFDDNGVTNIWDKEW